MSEEHRVDIAEAEAFLTTHYEMEATGVELVGEGAWSRCFGYRHDEEDLVIRFGNHVDDFHKDQRSYRYATPDLPIPEVLTVGPAFDGYYAISTRVRGVPLESVDAHQWRLLIPSIVSALETMRVADLTPTSGIGGWDAEERAPSSSWSDHLLTVVNDTPEMRSYGWRQKLAEHPEGDTTFAWGLKLLEQVVTDSIPRGLIHGDLINRNVLVENDGISGLFDWGCSRYGDHLYDLAWFEFWGSWYPELDVRALRSALEQRWRQAGHVPYEKESRLTACYLHIGLDHLAYNAHTGDQDNLLATAARMRAMVKG